MHRLKTLIAIRPMFPLLVIAASCLPLYAEPWILSLAGADRGALMDAVVDGKTIPIPSEPGACQVLQIPR